MNFVEVSLTEDTVNKFQEDETISLDLENIEDRSSKAGTVLRYILDLHNIKYSLERVDSDFVHMFKFEIELERMKKIEAEKFTNVILSKNDHLSEVQFLGENA